MAVLNIADAEGNNLGNLLTWHWRSDKKIRNSFMLNVKAPLAQNGIRYVYDTGTKNIDQLWYMQNNELEAHKKFQLNSVQYVNHQFTRYYTNFTLDMVTDWGMQVFDVMDDNLAFAGTVKQTSLSSHAERPVIGWLDLKDTRDITGNNNVRWMKQMVISSGSQEKMYKFQVLEQQQTHQGFLAVAVRYDSTSVMNSDDDRDFLIFAIRKNSYTTLPSVVVIAFRFPTHLSMGGINHYAQIWSTTITSNINSGQQLYEVNLFGFVSDKQEDLGMLNTEHNFNVKMKVSVTPFLFEKQGTQWITTNVQVPNPVTDVSVAKTVHRVLWQRTGATCAGLTTCRAVALQRLSPDNNRHTYLINRDKTRAGTWANLWNQGTFTPITYDQTFNEKTWWAIICNVCDGQPQDILSEISFDGAGNRYFGMPIEDWIYIDVTLTVSGDSNGDSNVIDCHDRSFTYIDKYTDGIRRASLGNIVGQDTQPSQKHKVLRVMNVDQEWISVTCTNCGPCPTISLFSQPENTGTYYSVHPEVTVAASSKQWNYLAEDDSFEVFMNQDYLANVNEWGIRLKVQNSFKDLSGVVLDSVNSFVNARWTLVGLNWSKNSQYQSTVSLDAKLLKGIVFDTVNMFNMMPSPYAVVLEDGIVPVSSWTNNIDYNNLNWVPYFARHVSTAPITVSYWPDPVPDFRALTPTLTIIKDISELPYSIAWSSLFTLTSPMASMRVVSIDSNGVKTLVSKYVSGNYCLEVTSNCVDQHINPGTTTVFDIDFFQSTTIINSVSVESVNLYNLEAISQTRVSRAIGEWPYGQWVLNATLSLSVTITNCVGQSFTIDPLPTILIQSNEGNVQPLTASEVSGLFHPAFEDRCTFVSAVMPTYAHGIGNEGQRFILSNYAQNIFKLDSNMAAGTPLTKYTQTPIVFTVRWNTRNPLWFAEKIITIQIGCFKSQTVLISSKNSTTTKGFNTVFNSTLDFHIEINYDRYRPNEPISSSFALSEVIEITQTPANLDCFEFIFKDSTRALTSADSLYVTDHLVQGVDQVLYVDHRTPLFEKEIFLYTNHSFDNTLSNTLKGTITVCGDEVITVTNQAEELRLGLNLEASPDLIKTYSIWGLFVSTNLCPIISIELCTDQSCSSAPDNTTVWLVQTENSLIVNVNATSELPSTTYFVRATSYSKKTAKISFKVQFEPKESPEGKLLSNTFPQFSESLPPEVSLKVVADHNGDILNQETSYKYTSPQTHDKEGNKVVMNFSGLEQLLGSRTKQNEDGTFSLTVNLAIISAENSGNYTLSIQLGDEINSKGPTSTMHVRVAFEQLKPPALEKSSQNDTIDSSAADLSSQNETIDFESQPTSSEIEVVSKPETESYVPEKFVVQYDPQYVYEYYQGNTPDDSPPTQVEDTLDKPSMSFGQQKLAEYKAKVAIEEKKQEQQRLNSKGLQKSRLGFVMPGTDVKNQIAEQQKAIEALDGDVPEPLKPKMKIGAISGKGEVEISFNTPMLYPETINQDTYKGVFGMSIESNVDQSVAYGRIGETPTSKSRSLRTSLEEQDQAANLQFGIEITEHSATKIKLKARFENPNAVSAVGKDLFSLEVTESSVFKTPDNKPLESSSFEEGEPKIIKITPPIMEDEELMDSLNNSTASTGTTLNFLSSSNFFISLLIGGSLQELWGMIRALQMIILPQLLNVAVPAPVLVFFQACIVVAAMDVFNGEDWFENNLNFVQSDPYTQNFELFGIGDMNFMLNSGSYFVIMLGMLVNVLLKIVINAVCIRLAKHAAARKIGIFFYEDAVFSSLKNNFLKLFMETYFDNSFGVTLNTISLIKAAQDGHLGMHFGSRDDIFCSLVTIVHFVAIFVFPYWAYRQIKSNFYTLSLSETRERIGFLYEGAKTKHGIHAYYNIFFLLRRLMTTLVIIFMTESPFFQVQFLLLFSTAHFIYIVSYSPLNTKKENIIETFNEFTIMLSVHITNVFLNVAVQRISRDIVGWTLMGLVSFNILVNMGIVLYETITGLWKSFRQNLVVTKATNRLHRRLTNRKYLIDQIPKEFKEFEAERSFYEAVKKVKQYMPQRKWMDANGVDYTQFDDEKEFKLLDKKLKLETRAIKVRFTRALIYAASKKGAEMIVAKNVEAKKHKEANRVEQLLKKFNPQSPITKKLFDIREQRIRVAEILQTQDEKTKQENQEKNLQDLIINDNESLSSESSEEEKPIVKKLPQRLGGKIRGNRVQVDKKGNANLTVVHEKSSEEGSSSEGDKDEKKEKPQKELSEEKAVKLMQFREALKMDKVRGFEPQTKYFVSNVAKDIQNCEKIFKHGGLKKKNAEALKQEFVMQRKELSKETKDVDKFVYEQTFSTHFLLDEVDLEEYGDEVYKELYRKTKEEMVDDYLNSGLVQHLVDETSHQAVVAILQCLIEIGILYQHVLSTDFTPNTCQTIQAFKRASEQIFRKKFAPLQKKTIDISYLAEQLSAEGLKLEEMDADSIVEKLLRTLEKEEKIDKNLEEDDNSPVLSAFQARILETETCNEKQHVCLENQRSTHMVNFTRDSTVMHQFKYLFKQHKKWVRCSECDEIQKVKGISHNRLLKMPKFLMIKLEMFDEWEGNKLGENQKIMPYLNLKSFQEEKVKTTSVQGKYRLCAMVTQTGSNRSESKYEAVVLKRDNQWRKFSKKGIRVIDFEKITNENFEPQVLFYRFEEDDD